MEPQAVYDGREVKMHRRHLLPVGIVGLFLAGGVTLAAVSLAGGAGDPGSVTNRGKLIPLAPNALVGLYRRDGTPVQAAALIAERGPRAFYRLDRGDGTTCYAVGRGVEQAAPGILKCGRDLLTAGRPIIDLSVFELQRDSPRGKLISLAGIASDIVATIAIRDENGKVLAEIPVKDNVYQADQVSGGSSLAALDKDGVTLYTFP